MSGTDREPPSDKPTSPSNVVPLRARTKRPAPKPVAGLPERTGVASMQGDPLLANLRASALTDATIDAARLFTLSSAKWREYGFRSGRPQSGLFFPFFAPGEAQPFEYRVRPQYPLPAPKGKTKKYDQHKDTGLLVYTPPLPATLEHLRDLQTPLVWAEGEKKALLLAQLGYCVVGLTGVWNWHDEEAKQRGEGRRLHEYILQHYGIAGREQVVVFDSDARTKPQVKLAMQRLAGVLLAAGASAVHACLPPDGGGAKGIDDYAQAHGVEACASLLATVREPIEELAPDLGCVPLAHYGEVFAGSGAERLRMPRGYECERDGSIWYVEDAAHPDNRQQVLNAPMVIARQLVDLYSGEMRSDVRFLTARGHWCSVLVAREVLGDRSLVQALRPMGAMVNAGTSASTMRYLDAFEADNGPLIEQVRCVPQTGWHEQQFVLHRTIARDESHAAPIQLDGSPDLVRLASVVRPHPQAELHQHVAALRVPMDASPDCTLVVLAALTAPLLYILQQHNYALHLCGDSSRGKTSMLRVAASVYGDPFSPQWVASWNSTITAMEQRATMLCDLPQFYDEVGAADPEQLASHVYTLVNGEGRQRSSKELRMRATLGWRTVVISSGESELASEKAPTGVQARVLSLPIQGFGPLGAAEIDAAVRACAAQHGALGASWLHWLVNLSEQDRQDLRSEYADRARDMHRIAKERNDTIGQRQAGFYAAMQIAEAQLHGLWGLGRENGATAYEAFAANDNGQADERRVRPLAERVLAALREWVGSEPRSFPNLHADTDAPRVFGYQGSSGVVNFLPGLMQEYLAARGLTLTRALKRELAAKGVLITEPAVRENSSCYLVRVTPAGGQRQYVLALRLGI